MEVLTTGDKIVALVRTTNISSAKIWGVEFCSEFNKFEYDISFDYSDNDYVNLVIIFYALELREKIVINFSFMESILFRNSRIYECKDKGVLKLLVFPNVERLYFDNNIPIQKG